jgi:hypothetical protein
MSVSLNIKYEFHSRRKFNFHFKMCTHDTPQYLVQTEALIAPFLEVLKTFYKLFFSSVLLLILFFYDTEEEGSIFLRNLRDKTT